MEVLRADEACSIKYSIDAGNSESGNPKYKTRSISGLNPALEDAEFFAVAQAINKLFSEECAYFSRVQTSRMVQSN